MLLCILESKPKSADIAAELGVDAKDVYLAKRRIQRKLVWMREGEEDAKG